MSVFLSPPMFYQFFVPGTNAPAVGYKLFTYVAGTSTKQATWTDSTQMVQNANPIIADSSGIMQIWLDPTLLYKFVFTTPNDTDPPTSPLRTTDNLSAYPSLTYKSTYGSVSTAISNILANWESPANYGTYYGDGTHDDTATLTAFFAAANTNLSGTPNGWTNGVVPGSPLTSSTVVIPGIALNIWFAGQPTASPSFTSGGTPYVNDCMFNVTGNDIDFYNPCFDGNVSGSTCIANGFSLNGGRIRMHEITGTHYPLYGVAMPSTGGGDNHIYGHQLQQFENGDTPFLVQSHFTADGIYVNHSDCSIDGGYSRWNKYEIHLGASCGNLLVTHLHEYGGNAGLTTTPNPFLDPIGILIDRGASGFLFKDCYIDNTHIDVYSQSGMIKDCLFVQNANANFSNDSDGVPHCIRVFCDGQSHPYGLVVESSLLLLSTTNTPNNANPTALIGYLPNPLTTPTTAAASSAGTATINVTAWNGPQPHVGSVVIVAGITPNGFNGTYSVTASSATSVSYANATAGPQTVAGTIQVEFAGTWTSIAALLPNAAGVTAEARQGTVKIWHGVDTVVPEEQEIKSVNPIVNTWQIGSGAATTLTKDTGKLTFSGSLGVNGASPPAQVTGWGAPVGAAVINNYNITDAGGANSNTNKAVAKILAYLISKGDFAA